MLKERKLCMNCLGQGHFARNCKSVNRCKVCQRPHHTLVHSDERKSTDSASTRPQTTDSPPTVSEGNVRNLPSYHTSTHVGSSTLLMTCRVMVTAQNGSSVEARALLDILHQPRLCQNALLNFSNSHVPTKGSLCLGSLGSNTAHQFKQ